MSTDERPRRPALFIFLLALGINLLWVYAYPSTMADSEYYDRVAWNLASGHGYSMSESAPYMPYFKKPLGYPTFLALIYMAFGHDYLFVYLIQAFLHAGTVVLLFFIARETMEAKLAALAALLYALNPFSSSYAATIMTECVFTFFLTLALWLLVLATGRHRESPARYLVLAGAVTAAGALFRPIIQYIPVLALISFPFFYKPMKRALQYAAIFCLAFGLVVMPSVWRTYTLFGELRIATIKGSWSLYSGTLEYSGEGWESLVSADHQQQDTDIIMASSDYDEVEAAYERYHEKAMANIRARPGQFLKSVIIRFFRIWISSYHPKLSPAILTAVRVAGILFLVLGIAGVALSYPEWRKFYWILVTMFFCNVVSSLGTTQARYTIPLRGLMTLFVVVAIGRALSRLPGLKSLFGRRERSR